MATSPRLTVCRVQGSTRPWIGRNWRGNVAAACDASRLGVFATDFQYSLRQVCD